MGVGAAEAEAVDADTFITILRLRSRSGGDDGLRLFKGNGRVGRQRLDTRGNRAILQRKHGLDDSHRARCTLCVAQICLDRADVHSGLAKASRHGRRLQGVAGSCARAVALKVARPCNVGNARVAVRLSDEGFLRLGAGQRNR